LSACAWKRDMRKLSAEAKEEAKDEETARRARTAKLVFFILNFYLWQTSKQSDFELTKLGRPRPERLR
jgi:UDP-N-acetylglucosamine pyrophosphorylase